MKSLDNYFFYLKSAYATYPDDSDLKWLQDYENRKNLKLIFQFVAQSEGWKDKVMFSIWKKTSNYYGEFPLILKIESANIRSCYNGFDNFIADEKQCKIYNINRLDSILGMLQEVDAPDLSISTPLLVAAFEGEGAQLIQQINPGKKDQFYKHGGSSFQALGIANDDFKDREFDSKISKKEAQDFLDRQFEMAIQLPEEYREKHIWFLDQVGLALVAKISSFVSNLAQKKKPSK